LSKRPTKNRKEQSTGGGGGGSGFCDGIASKWPMEKMLANGQ